MNRCKNCGTEFEGNFCPNCGTRVMNYCSNCGAKLEANQNFCPNCGKKLTNTYAQSEAAATQAAKDKTAVKAKAAAILTKTEKYIGAVFGAFYGAFMFLFLAGDFYSMMGIGESCYSMLRYSETAPITYTGLLMGFGFFTLIISLIHIIRLYTEKKGKKLKASTNKIFLTIESVLILGATITGCAASGWVNSNTSYNTGSGLNCVMAFGFIFIILIAAVITTNYLLTKNANTTTQPDATAQTTEERTAAPAQPAEEAAVAEDTPATAEETTENTPSKGSSEKTKDKQ